MKVNFKSLDYIDKILMRLNEAAEDDAAETDTEPEQDTEDDGATEDEAAPEDETGGEDADMGGAEEPQNEEAADPNNNPNNIPEPDKGTFISDLGKAEYANIMIKALMMTPPKGIPQEWLNSTNTNNADQIIDFVKNVVNVNQAGTESFSNMSDEEFMNVPV